MKRSDMLFVIAEIINDAKFGRLDVEVDNFQLAELILKAQEDLGMSPPPIRLSTPYGARIFLETNDWEENALYDEAGYDLGEGPDPDLKQAKVIR